MSLGRKLRRGMERAGEPRPHRARREPPVFNVNYKELEEKLFAGLLQKTKDFRHPLNYDARGIEELTREAERILKVYGNVTAEVSPTGRMSLHDPPVYVQAGTKWKRVPED